MENVSLYEIITGLISLAVLIVFFVMASNINRIKKDIIDLKIIAMRDTKRYGVDLSTKPQKITNEKERGVNFIIWECPKCNNENPNNTYVCESCGHKLK